MIKFVLILVFVALIISVIGIFDDSRGVENKAEKNSTSKVEEVTTVDVEKAPTSKIKEVATVKNAIAVSKKTGSVLLQITDAFVDGMKTEYNNPTKETPEKVIKKMDDSVKLSP